jgi:hypothetical protein
MAETAKLCLTAIRAGLALVSRLDTAFLFFQWPADPHRSPQDATNFGGRTLKADR